MISIKDLNIRDPYILCDGGQYYLYSSENTNDGHAFVCRKSSDMQSFDDKRTIFKPGDNFWATCDYWAPEVHIYNGKYYLFASLKSPQRARGTQIFVCDTPDGVFTPVSEFPVTPEKWECLDGTLFVENGVPYMIFCREWLEVCDGEMYIMQLSDDLTRAASEPYKLFSASTVKWVRPLHGDNYVTDGPFIVRQDGVYYMLWSSFAESGYAMGLCRSNSLFGPWEHSENQLNVDNGGHGMVFERDGVREIAYHSPNGPDGMERIKVIPFDKALGQSL